MPLDEPTGPDLAGVIADANAVGLECVVIGGFSVIFHGHVRATKDSDILVADGPAANDAIARFLERSEATRMYDGKVLGLEEIAAAHHIRVSTRHGIVDIMRGGEPPLDYETVSGRAEEAVWEGNPVRVAALPSVVGFKRLAGRPQDRQDLADLRAIYGELPIEAIPGVDE
jgi:hypothetical protein